jgi:hypothetical protein
MKNDKDDEEFFEMFRRLSYFDQTKLLLLMNFFILQDKYRTFLEHWVLWHLHLDAKIRRLLCSLKPQ